jgi:DNA helicase HerA-like ATPase
VLKAKRFYDISIKKEQNEARKGPLKIKDVEAELLRGSSNISLDSPTPYRVRDLIKVLDNEMGKLENSNNLAPYIRLKRRIETFLSDPRYQFVFRNQARPDAIENVLGSIFRIPVAGKPISILDLSGIPSNALNIVVSVVSRLAFELALWSQRQIPILLLCEEAHRYIPADKSLGFASTRRAISTIAKEGRKYGVSLGIISQRPSELEPSTLSQCSTVFSMRLSNERDQHFVRAAVPDGAVELLNFLPSLGTAETIVFGESVNLPMRVVLNHLPSHLRPHSSSAKFSDQWNKAEVSQAFMAKVFDNWRHRAPKHDVSGEGPRPLSAVAPHMNDRRQMQTRRAETPRRAADQHANPLANVGTQANLRRALQSPNHAQQPGTARSPESNTNIMQRLLNARKE